MSAIFLSLVVATVRSWVRLYTTGLAAARRDARRAEVEADLWDEEWDGSQASVWPTKTALQILGRLVLGMPTDVGWRLSRGSAERQAARVGFGVLKMGGSMIAFVIYRSFIGLGGVLLALFGVIGLAIIRRGAYAARRVIQVSGPPPNAGVRLWTRWFLASVGGSAVGAIIGTALGLGMGVLLGVAVFGLVVGLSQSLVLEQRLNEGTNWETASLAS